MQVDRAGRAQHGLAQPAHAEQQQQGAHDELQHRDGNLPERAAKIATSATSRHERRQRSQQCRSAIRERRPPREPPSTPRPPPPTKRESADDGRPGVNGSVMEISFAAAAAADSSFWLPFAAPPRAALAATAFCWASPVRGIGHAVHAAPAFARRAIETLERAVRQRKRALR